MRPDVYGLLLRGAENAGVLPDLRPAADEEHDGLHVLHLPGGGGGPAELRHRHPDDHLDPWRGAVRRILQRQPAERVLSVLCHGHLQCADPPGSPDGGGGRLQPGADPADDQGWTPAVHHADGGVPGLRGGGPSLCDFMGRRQGAVCRGLSRGPAAVCQHHRLCHPVRGAGDPPGQEYAPVPGLGLSGRRRRQCGADDPPVQIRRPGGRGRVHPVYHGGGERPSHQLVFPPPCGPGCPLVLGPHRPAAAVHAGTRHRGGAYRRAGPGVRVSGYSHLGLRVRGCLRRQPVAVWHEPLRAGHRHRSAGQIPPQAPQKGIISFKQPKGLAVCKVQAAGPFDIPAADGLPGRAGETVCATAPS